MANAMQKTGLNTEERNIITALFPEAEFIRTDYGNTWAALGDHGQLAKEERGEFVWFEAESGEVLMAHPVLSTVLEAVRL